MLRLADLELFVRSSALGSFTAAALEANLLPGQVAAAIKRLERDLDVRLFVRTTRSLRLTAEGERYLPTAVNVLESLRRAHDDLHGNATALRGTLQVSAPSDLGRNMLLPWLSAFRREHPALHLRFMLSDQIADLSRDPVDVAVRYGLNQDANYIALPLADWNQRVLVASPDYLARHGRPQTPEALHTHACLLYMQHGRVYDKWQLGQRTVHVQGPLVSDDADVIRRLAVLGEGIVYKSWLDVSDDLACGQTGNRPASMAGRADAGHAGMSAPQAAHARRHATAPVAAPAVRRTAAGSQARQLHKSSRHLEPGALGS